MIRTAELTDLERICEIYMTARAFMRQNGNGTQWGTGYPPRAALESDILKGQLYVCVRDGVIRGVFAFIIGDDPTYSYIEKGSWKNGGVYGAIHRIASDGSARGILAECLDYCKDKIGYIRIDTHENNLIMQRLLIRHGFEKSGIIYIDDGSPRIAYERVFHSCI